jgi:hypothetical protein
MTAFAFAPPGRRRFRFGTARAVVSLNTLTVRCRRKMLLHV